MDPVEIFPEEVWADIINKLNVTDKQTAYNTCQLWRRHLKKKPNVWMFEGVFPRIIKYLSKSDILEARLVCKGWKGIINSYLGNDQPTIVAPGGYILFTQQLFIRTFGVSFRQSAAKLGIQPLEALQRFQSQFETEQVSTRNPFVSRSLYLDVCVMEVNVKMTILRFFQTFGVHLFSLELFIRESAQASQQIATHLQIATFVFNILANVPNLRKLSLKTGQKFEDHPDECVSCKMQSNELDLFLEENPVPALPRLSNLQLDVHPLMRQALESAYGPQLEVYAQFRLQRSFPTNLNNSITKGGWHFTRDCPIKHLKKLKSGERQSLQRLHVNTNSQQFEGWFWHNFLYETLEGFQRSLTHLSIQWNRYNTVLPKQLHLPLLQELFLEIRCCYNPYFLKFSFLQNLKSLREVKCAFWKFDFEQFLKYYKNKEKPKYRLGEEESVDLQYHLDDASHGGPYKSNVWKLVPSLDRIEIQVAKYENYRMVTLHKFYTRGHKEKKGIM